MWKILNHTSVQRRSASGKLGLSPLQKVTAAFRILSHGIGADYVDEYVIIGETTAIKGMKLFVRAIISMYGEEYLRSPNNNDISRLLAKGERRGFPGMLEVLIVCIGNGRIVRLRGKVCLPVMFVNQQLFWKRWRRLIFYMACFFGLPGSHNDINVLERSNVFAELTEGRAPEVNYSVNGHDYTMGYYIVDGIYPTWSTFVKTISAPQSKKHKVFAKAQESVRKDVERAFGVLQARFAIIREPARYFNQSTLKDIMMACVILHNMIVEDERDSYLGANDFDYDCSDCNDPEPVSRNPTNEFVDFLQRHRNIRNKENHIQLQLDLIEHQWLLYGQR